MRIDLSLFLLECVCVLCVCDIKRERQHATQGSSEDFLEYVALRWVFKNGSNSKHFKSKQEGKKT